MTKTIIIYPYLKYDSTRGTSKSRLPENSLAEAVTLCKAISLEICDSLVVVLRKFDAGHVFTSGKLEEIREKVDFHKAELVIVDGPVSPVQQRNLEKHLGVKVLDRIGLILEIFGERAATREGNLQVDLARLSYQKSRLVKAWSHLERQRGGGGFTGGPGETQKESDRRMIDDKIKRIEKKLDDVVNTRKLHRSARQKVPYPIVALSGYTNAGKSTLFNRLTDADVLEADMLFATLDPTLRTIKLGTSDKIILSDTVGFISDLPTQLVKAFRATLEEVTEANLILHVRDVSHAETHFQKSDVLNVLKDLGVTDNIHIIEVLNKADLLLEREDGADILTQITAENELAGITTVTCSALTGQGIDDVKQMIQNFLNQEKSDYHFSLSAQHSEALASLYRYANVIHREDKDDGIIEIDVQITQRNLGILQKQFPEIGFCV